MTCARCPPAKIHAKQQEHDREDHCEVNLTTPQVLSEQREAIAAESRSQTCGGEDPQKAVSRGEAAQD